MRVSKLGYAFMYILAHARASSRKYHAHDYLLCNTVWDLLSPGAMRTGRSLIPWAASQGVFLDEAPCWIDVQDNRRRLLVHLGIQRNAKLAPSPRQRAAHPCGCLEA